MSSIDPNISSDVDTDDSDDSTYNHDGDPNQDDCEEDDEEDYFDNESITTTTTTNSRNQQSSKGSTLSNISSSVTTPQSRTSNTSSNFGSSLPTPTSTTTTTTINLPNPITAVEDVNTFLTNLGIMNSTNTIDFKTPGEQVLYRLFEDNVPRAKSNIVQDHVFKAAGIKPKQIEEAMQSLVARNILIFKDTVYYVNQELIPKFQNQQDRIEIKKQILNYNQLNKNLQHQINKISNRKIAIQSQLPTDELENEVEKLKKQIIIKNKRLSTLRQFSADSSYVNELKQKFSISLIEWSKRKSLGLFVAQPYLDSSGTAKKARHCFKDLGLELEDSKQDSLGIKLEDYMLWGINKGIIDSHYQPILLQNNDINNNTTNNNNSTKNQNNKNINTANNIDDDDNGENDDDDQVLVQLGTTNVLSVNQQKQIRNDMMIKKQKQQNQQQQITTISLDDDNDVNNNDDDDIENNNKAHINNIIKPQTTKSNDANKNAINDKLLDQQQQQQQQPAVSQQQQQQQPTTAVKVKRVVKKVVRVVKKE